eukprot:CAMPEP_0184501490 /NCGR_PEP_ID=MMETSP0113_2-20130426/47832_1 /TAXON_ID=91329 /ORGANISM="Norrisiella sphaerica, Strain BC52" /LENGTH=449 /DNA_ID=CAMNT_0026890277 /DNA_START=1071 /DNA_END=2420 /DNA_ORIENTATION=+
MEIRNEFVRAAVLGNGDEIKRDEEVYRLLRPLSIPIGSDSLGRTFDALGRPKEGGEGLDDVIYYSLKLESQKPFKYQTSQKFIPTGLKYLDVFRPLVEGGRFGILGTNTSAKSDVAISILQGEMVQESLDGVVRHFIYVTIGGSERRQEEIENKLRKIGALDRCILIHAGDESGPVLQYLAPLVGSVMSDFFRDNGMHVVVIFDEFSKHYEAYELLSTQMEMSKPAIVQTYAQIMNHFTVASNYEGAGSSTALVLAHSNPDILEPYVEELTTFLDSTLHIDKKLQAQKIFPGVSLQSLVQGTPSPYQLPMVRGFYIRMLQTLRNTHTLSQRAAMANELGIDLFEESEVDITGEMEFPRKFEALLNQCVDQPLQITLIALYMATKTLLIGFDYEQLRDYDIAVHNFLLKERPEILSPWPLDHEVPKFIFEDLDRLAVKFSTQHIASVREN